MTEAVNTGLRLTPSEQLAYSTVRIESVDARRGLSRGTAFFYRCVEENGQYVPVLGTNKHVVAGGKIGRFHLTLGGADRGPAPGTHLRIDLEDFKKRWLPHPHREVDRAVMCEIPRHAAAADERRRCRVNARLVPERVADSRPRLSGGQRPPG